MEKLAIERLTHHCDAAMADSGRIMTAWEPAAPTPHLFMRLYYGESAVVIVTASAREVRMNAGEDWRLADLACARVASAIRMNLEAEAA